MRSQNTSVMNSPILIGSVTCLVVTIAVFLSSNAKEGVPFVPTYDIQALVPSAAGLVRGNEVRIGGKRVGVVKAIEAEQPKGGRHPIARLGLKLDKTPQPN